MKKLILVISIVFSGMLLMAQIEVKGVELGAKYDGNDTIETTLGGFNGELTIQTLDDSRVWGITFKSSLNNPEMDIFDHEKLRKAIETKYGTNFSEAKELPSGNRFFKFKTGDVMYIYIILDSGTPKPGFSILIANTKLQKVKESNDQNKIINDL